MSEEDRRNMVNGYTNDRTDSVPQMTTDEFGKMVAKLAENIDDEITPMIRSITHYCCMLGMQNEERKPDYDRINAWVQAIGTNNPKKKK
jgi:hypothetical protein